MVAQLGPVLAPRMASLEFDEAPVGPVFVPLEQDEAEALAWRLLATLAGACSAGEILTISLSGVGGMARLDCGLPVQLIAEDDIFSAHTRPATGGISAGLFGAGFSLRLARAEARGAQGDLSHDEDRVRLTLPLLTRSGGLPSEEAVRWDKKGLAQS
jgi:hypothetical protein